MMRWLSLLLIVLLAWFAWALATLPPGSAALRVPAPAPGDPPVVRGAYHVHSQVSDGTGTLEEIAVGDADLEIQEQAVFALSQLPGDEGLDALIRLAKTHRDARIRKRAVFWLGESEDPRALEALIAIVKGK